MLFRCRKSREIYTDERGRYVAYVGPKCLFGSFLSVETHEIHSDNDKWDAEPLAHVQRHAVFKVHLVFFQELDEETEEEDFRQAEAEEETAVIG